MELTKGNYIKQRGNSDILFQMFCEIRKLKPTKEEMRIIAQFISINKLVKILDGYFRVTLVIKNNKIIKVI